jgi:peptide/nickel transport system permease protein
MRRYVIRRLLLGILILLVLSLAVFALLRVGPGDPAISRCGLSCTPEQIAAIRANLGLNDPYPVQYARWLGDVLSGDLGEATFSREPVLDSLRERLPVTIELMVITILVTAVLGIAFGIISAIYRNSAADYAVRITAVLGLSLPGFWLATLALLIPVRLWGYAPPLGSAVGFFDDPLGNLRQFVPPGLILGLASAAVIMRLTRSSLLEVLGSDYVRTARSKGLAESVVVGRHALRNSVIPVVTVLGLQVAGLLGGTVIIENIFALPGIGRYFLQTLVSRDYTVVQSLTLYIGAVVVVTNLLVDISYAWLDPRIRYD